MNLNRIANLLDERMGLDSECLVGHNSIHNTKWESEHKRYTHYSISTSNTLEEVTITLGRAGLTVTNGFRPSDYDHEAEVVDSIIRSWNAAKAVQ